MKHAYLSLAAAIAVAVPSTAQVVVGTCSGFDPNFGTNLAQTGIDQTSAGLALGFNFNSPGGAVWTSVDMDSHGRVFDTAAGELSDFSPTIAEFETLDAINVGWTDMVVGQHAAGVGSGDPNHNCYFYADPGGTYCNFTWFQMQPFGGGVQFDIQLVIRADQSMSMIYGGAFPSIPPFIAGDPDAIIGTSDGVTIGTTSVDIATTGQTAAIGTLYEAFSMGAVDVTGLQIDWIPNGGAGTGYTTIVSTCPFGAVTETAANCDAGLPPGPAGGIDFLAAGGDWLAITGTGAYDGVNIGAPLGMGDDTIAAGQALGFSWTFPGGTAATDIDIDSNGPIYVAGAGAASDFTPTTAELHSAVAPLIGFWSDFSPNIAGDVYFYTDNVSRANITWIDVPQFGQTNSNTFQIQLDGATGNWSFYYESIDGMATTPLDVLLGGSPGLGHVDPGEVDLSTNGITLPGEPSLYEFFDSALPENQDFQSAGAAYILDANALNVPAIGGPGFDTNVTGIGAGANDVVALMTLPGAGPLDLGAFPLGLTDPGCLLHATGAPLFNISLALTGGWTPGADTGTFSLPAPGPNLSGFQFSIQFVVVDLNVAWALTGLPIHLSSGLNCTAGL